MADTRLPDGEAFLAAVKTADFAEPGIPLDAPELEAALRWAGPATGMALHLDRTEGTRGGSDYRDFARAGVPFIRFFGNFFPELPRAGRHRGEARPGAGPAHGAAGVRDGLAPRRALTAAIRSAGDRPAPARPRRPPAGRLGCRRRRRRAGRRDRRAAPGAARPARPPARPPPLPAREGLRRRPDPRRAPGARSRRLASRGPSRGPRGPSRHALQPGADRGLARRRVPDDQARGARRDRRGRGGGERGGLRAGRGRRNRRRGRRGAASAPPAGTCRFARAWGSSRPAPTSRCRAPSGW